MSAAREPDQADFDLERFIDMFDEAVASQDPRVMNALRSLMMMVTLTRPESHGNPMADRNVGPLRRLFEDMNHLHRRLERVEEEVRQAERSQRSAQIDPYNYPYEKYTMAAAQGLAQSIDQDVLAKIQAQNAAKINSGGVFPAKGLLDK